MKVPLAILVADTHSDKDNLQEVKDILEQAVDLAIHHKAKNIFHLGDVFTSRVGQGLQVLLSQDNWIRKCSKVGIHLHVIAGNHDKTDLDDEASYLDVIFRGFRETVTVYRKETAVEIDGVLCCFLPYFKEGGSYPGRLADLVSRARKSGSKKKLLFTHIAVDGVRNNDGSPVENSLKANMFKEFHTVFVGHYHNRSQVGDNIFYIGSPRPKDFGEDNEKGFTLLYPDGTHELALGGFRKFIKVQVDLSEGKEKIEELKAEYAESEHRVRFVVTGEEEDLSLISTKEFADLGIEIKKEPIRLARSLEAAENSEFVEFDKKTIIRAFLQYCSENGINGPRRKLGMKFIQTI